MTSLERRQDTELPGEILARISAPQFVGTEQASDYHTLRVAHLSELDPKTPYETSLTEQLVRFEWELIRLCRLRDAAALEEARAIASNIIARGDPNHRVSASQLTEEAFSLAHDLFCENGEDRRLAEQDFREQTGWTVENVFAMAFARSRDVEKLEARIADVERRRRQLRQDYARLQATRTNAVSVADADLIEEHDDN